MRRLWHLKIKILEYLPPFCRWRAPDSLLRLPAADVDVRWMEAQVGGSGGLAAFDYR